MRILQRLAVVALLVVVPIIPSHGQNTPLTKEQVIQMSKAGVADDVIVARIKAEPSPVNLNTDDLIALKSAGVSDAVVRVPWPQLLKPILRRQARRQRPRRP